MANVNAHPERMLVQIIGPNGEAVAPGQAVPGSWDRDYVDSLINDGAAAVITDEQATALTARPVVVTTVDAKTKGA